MPFRCSIRFASSARGLPDNAVEARVMALALRVSRERKWVNVDHPSQPHDPVNARR